MQVIFVRLDSRRYGIGIDRCHRRDIGPNIAVRPGPGCATVPHDLVHFVVEEQAQLRLGIFGQVAAGGSAGFFVPAPADRSGADRKRSDRLGRAGRRDVARSEKLTALVDANGSLCSDADAITGDPGLTSMIRDRLGEVLQFWSVLPVGQRMLLTWPASLTIRHAQVPARPGRVNGRERARTGA